MPVPPERASKLNRFEVTDVFAHRCDGAPRLLGVQMIYGPVNFWRLRTIFGPKYAFRPEGRWVQVVLRRAVFLDCALWCDMLKNLCVPLPGRLMSMAASTRAQDPLHDAVAPLLQGMCVSDKIGQMTQLDITEILLPNEPFALDEDAVRRYARLGVGSFLNSPTAAGPRMGLVVPTSAQWRSLLQRLKDIYTSEGKVTWHLQSTD